MLLQLPIYVEVLDPVIPAYGNALIIILPHPPNGKADGIPVTLSTL